MSFRSQREDIIKSVSNNQTNRVNSINRDNPKYSIARSFLKSGVNFLKLLKDRREKIYDDIYTKLKEYFTKININSYESNNINIKSLGNYLSKLQEFDNYRETLETEYIKKIKELEDFSSTPIIDVTSKNVEKSNVQNRLNTIYKTYTFDQWTEKIDKLELLSNSKNPLNSGLRNSLELIRDDIKRFIQKIKNDEENINKLLNECIKLYDTKKAKLIEIFIAKYDETTKELDAILNSTNSMINNNNKKLYKVLSNAKLKKNQLVNKSFNKIYDNYNTNELKNIIEKYKINNKKTQIKTKFNSKLNNLIASRQKKLNTNGENLKRLEEEIILLQQRIEKLTQIIAKLKSIKSGGSFQINTLYSTEKFNTHLDQDITNKSAVELKSLIKKSTDAFGFQNKSKIIDYKNLPKNRQFEKIVDLQDKPNDISVSDWYIYNTSKNNKYILYRSTDQPFNYYIVKSESTELVY